MNEITSIGRFPAASPAAIGQRGPGDFAAVLRQSMERVNELQLQSGAEIQRWLSGESEDLHKTILAVQKSELAFELMLEVRNKVVQAYQEVMRIQV